MFFFQMQSLKNPSCVFHFFIAQSCHQPDFLQWHHILCSHTQPVPCRKIHCTEERDPCCCHCSAIHGIPCQIFELLSWALKDESPSHLNQDTCNIDRTLEHCKYDTFKNFLNSARYPFSSSSEVIDLRGGRIETAASPHLSGSSDGFCCNPMANQTKNKLWMIVRNTRNTKQKNWTKTPCIFRQICVPCLSNTCPLQYGRIHHVESHMACACTSPFSQSFETGSQSPLQLGFFVVKILNASMSWTRNQQINIWKTFQIPNGQTKGTWRCRKLLMIGQFFPVGLCLHSPWSHLAASVIFEFVLKPK